MNAIKLPDILSYPEIQKLEKIPEIRDQFVYVLKAYPLKGLAVLAYRKDENIYWRFGDFNGKLIDPTSNKFVTAFMNGYSSKLVELMKTAGIPQAQFYVAAERGGHLRLVDMRTSLNKFAGPGMLRDLCGKIMDTQEVIKTIQLTPDVLEAIQAGTGNYTGGIILKTSTFKTITKGVAPKLNMYPMYARVR